MEKVGNYKVMAVTKHGDVVGGVYSAPKAAILAFSVFFKSKKYTEVMFHESGSLTIMLATPSLSHAEILITNLGQIIVNFHSDCTAEQMKGRLEHYLSVYNSSKSKSDSYNFVTHAEIIDLHSIKTIFTLINGKISDI